MKAERLLPGIAFTWALAEALVFFVLPDFFLFPAAARRPGLWAPMTFASVAGSLAGATILFALTLQAPDAVDWSIRHISIVSDAEFGRARELLDRYQLVAFIYQPFSLVPLKVFVNLSARDNLALAAMLAFIALGRSLRNVMAAYAGAWLGRRFPAAIEKSWRTLLYIYIPIATTLVAWSMVRS